MDAQFCVFFNKIDPPAFQPRLYRRRMSIEQGFRDFKTHLGVRGLQLQVRIPERVQRLLQAFTLAYALIVSLGMTPVSQMARRRLEDPRITARHATNKILSARTVTALLLCGLCGELLLSLQATLHQLISYTLAGQCRYDPQRSAQTYLVLSISDLGE